MRNNLPARMRSLLSLSSFHGPVVDESAISNIGLSNEYTKHKLQNDQSHTSRNNDAMRTATIDQDLMERPIPLQGGKFLGALLMSVRYDGHDVDTE